MLLANKLVEKIFDPCNAKEHYQLFIEKKNTNTQSISHSKTLENPNIADVKPIITEHAKTSQKLSKTIKQAKKVGSNSHLYSDTKKVENFLNKKNVKITSICF